MTQKHIENVPMLFEQFVRVVLEEEQIALGVSKPKISAVQVDDVAARARKRLTDAGRDIHTVDFGSLLLGLTMAAWRGESENRALGLTENGWPA